MSMDLESLSEALRREVVERWIRLNIGYAERTLERGTGKSDSWEVWKAFHEHALSELGQGTLDPWIRNLHVPDFDPTSTDRQTPSPTLEGPLA